MRAAALLLPMALLACGPLPVHVAEQQCLQAAREARGPTGSAGIGVVSGGRGGTRTRGDLEITISSDWLAGKDPAAVYDTCVMSKSGQAPSRPLYQRSDWKG
ncbi:hypothetical protein [Pseudogemmobacter humi]|uniref:Lipoprotein n=1 Tax=Pseudogemmobacter humi TaxID=2483812 RepID=A0A3P5WU69_9RHOB|nr:hypothetical protein [Pseudogemmobacter humi]VDC25255.1 hypothetical protein XINFAN_01493 [Pseudogemmobacter humi]